MSLSYYVCGDPVGATSTNTLVIPITANVARSDPLLGGSFILIFWQTSYLSGVLAASVVDDATAMDDYSFCLFPDDGLNHYNVVTYPAFGILANDLVAGTHSITVTFDGTADAVYAAAIAVTGVDFANAGPLDPTLSGYFPDQEAAAPVGAPTSVAPGLNYSYNPVSGAITFLQPGTAADEDWFWEAGEIAFYVLQNNATNSDLLGWTWTDGAITDFLQWSVDEGIGRWFTMVIGTATVVPTAAGPSVAGIYGDGSYPPGGNGFAILSGFGPFCSPPPTTGIPIFDNRIRLLAQSVGDFTPGSSPCFNARIRLKDGPGGSTTPGPAPMFNNRTRLPGSIIPEVT